MLAEIECERNVLALCFDKTSTLGVRMARVKRAILRRHELVVRHGGNDYRVKIAERPGGLSAKVEMDDMLENGGDREQIETAALVQFKERQ